ncbi:MAG: hypothetical protein AVDCRST_MAG22-3483, partial [uncultured Rubrobacteraceae bacterium]
GRVDEPGGAGGQGVRRRQAQGPSARAEETAGGIRRHGQASVVRRGAGVARSVRRFSPRQEHGRGRPHSRQCGQTRPVRRRVHAASRCFPGPVEAHRPCLPGRRGVAPGEPLQPERRLFRPGWTSPRERGPLPRGGVDRRRGHGVQVVPARRENVVWRAPDAGYGALLGV